MFGNLPKTTQLIKQQDSSLQGPSLGLFLYLLKMGLKKNIKKRKTIIAYYPPLSIIDEFLKQTYELHLLWEVL